MLQLGILAAALLLAGFAFLRVRRPEPVLDWPPSPPPVRDIRRDLIMTSAAVMFIILALAVAALAITTAALQLVTGSGGPGPG